MPPLTTQGGITLDDGQTPPNMKGVNSLDANQAAFPLLGATDIRNGAFNGPPNFSHSLTLSTAATLSSGTGAPTIAGTAGDFFFRTDTPTVADQRIYVCTVTGGAGAATWVGIV